MQHDLHVAIRSLTLARANVLLAALVIGLGTGAVTAMFSAVRAVVLRPLPYPQPDRLVVLSDVNESKGLRVQRLPPARFLEWQRATDIFDLVGAYDLNELNLTGAGGPDRVQVARVSPEIFALAGAVPSYGRLLTDSDDEPSSAPVAILSERLWRRAFGASSQDGRTFRLDGAEFTAVGVVPSARALPFADVYVSLPLRVRESRVARYLHVICRLAPGIDVASARARVDDRSTRMAAAHPATDQGWTTTVVSLEDAVVGEVRPAVRVLLAAAIVFALVASASAGSLLLVRFAARRRDFVVRLALGATRARIARQVVLEALLIGVIGGTLALLIAVPLVRILSRLPFPRFDEIRIDPNVMAVAIVVSLLAALLAAILPMVLLGREDLRGVLTASGRSTAGRSSGRLGSVATAVQIATAVVLVMAAVTLSISFGKLIRVDPGFRAEGVFSARMVLPRASYRTGQDLRHFGETLVDRTLALPDVSAAAVVSSLPLAGRQAPFNFHIEGRPVDTHAGLSTAELRAVSPGYFEALGIPVHEGRPFAIRDSAEAPGVVMINRAMAARFWPNDHAIGRRISLDGPSGPWLTIIAIVGDVREAGLRVEPRPQMYRPYAQEPWPSVALVARCAAPRLLAPAVRRLVHEIDPELPVYDVLTMDEVVAAASADARVWMVMLQVLAGLALVLACAGVFGVTAHRVTERIPEIALRIALGAAPRSVVGAIVRRSMIPVLVGLPAGLAAALAGADLMSALLFGVGPRDPAVFAGAAGAVAASATLSCYLPARRGARVDPNVALRHL